MSSESSEKARKVQSAPQGSHQDAGGSRNGFQLLCPIRSAHPNLRTGTKTCDNNCKDIRRVKEHLRKRHRCTCPGKPASCDILSHFGPQKLKKLNAIRHRHRETPGEQWVRIYRIVSTNENEILAPYVLSTSTLDAIAQNPTPDLVEKYAESLQQMGHSSVDITLSFAHIRIFLAVVRRLGVHPNSDSVVLRGSNNTGVTGSHSSMQGPSAAELASVVRHQDQGLMDEEPDWIELTHLA